MDANLLSPIAALAVGFTTSLHCVIMCGPLACALRVKPLEYHGSRIVSYTAAGALAGSLGQGVVHFLKGDATRLVPWALAAVLLLIGLGLDKRIPQPRWLTAWLLRARLDRSLGLLTPLIPCGPLWLMLGAAAMTGAGIGGAALMASFVVGTIPLPFLLQSQIGRLHGRISPMALRWMQQAVALVSAGLLTWRAMLPAHGSCH